MEIKPTYELHKLPEGFIITSNQQPVNGLYLDTYINKVKNTNGAEYGINEITKQVIAQQNQIDFSNLTEEEQEEIGWIEPKSWNIEIETECSMCSLTDEHKMSCKTPSLRTQQPRFTNGKIKITKINE